MAATRVESCIIETEPKRWGSEETLFAGAYLVKRLILMSKESTSMHFHYAKCETIVVVSGVLNIDFDDSSLPSLELHAGQHCTIYEGRGNAHRMSNNGIHPCVYIEASTPHRCDAERIVAAGNPG